MKPIYLLFLWLMVTSISACAVNDAPSSGNAAYDLEIAKGRATSAAIETSARRGADAVATNDARTQIAADRDSTRAAQAQANAMLYAQATSTAQGQYAIATSTAQYSIARGAETSQAELAQASATKSARAADAAATSDAHTWQTTATAERRTIEAEQAHAQATATAQTIALQIQQAQADAEQAAEWNALAQSGLRFAAMVLGTAFLFASLILVVRGAFILSQMFASRAARALIIETRAGTVMLTPTARGTYLPSLVTAGEYAALPEGDTFEDTQAPRIEAEAVDMLKVTNAKGETFIAKEDPQEVECEHRRNLVLRLLRAAIDYCNTQRVDPRTTNQIPSYRDLKWSSESWVRAVALLKEAGLVTTQTGRGGGTFCAEKFPTLTQLYAAIGERRARPEVNQSPSPTLESVAA